MRLLPLSYFFFFFNDTATTEIYTLSLHDALPISDHMIRDWFLPALQSAGIRAVRFHDLRRSEEHTSELQSPCNLVCRLLLEKKKKTTMPPTIKHPQTHLTNPRPPPSPQSSLLVYS